MKTRLRYKLKEGITYVTKEPLLLGAELVNIEIDGTEFYVYNISGKEVHKEYVDGGNHAVKKAVKNYLKSQGVPFADEVRRRKENV
jgi:hypothetical protein